MCSVCGIMNFKNDGCVLKNAERINSMNGVMKHRGPDASGVFFGEGVTLGHNRLAVMDPENGSQPMTVKYRENEYTIVYNGEIYNAPELRAELGGMGASFETKCDTEAVLWSYVMFGDDCVTKLNGIFAFLVYDKGRKRVFMCRDRLGVKPLFYTFVGDTLLAASEIKGLLAHPGIRPRLGKEGLWQLLFLAPCTVPGSGVFEGINEMLPGECGVYDGDGLRLWKYWSLEAKPFEGDSDTAAEEVRRLLADAVERQLVSDVPISTLLSGGLDSSAISAIAAGLLRERGEKLSTYSFEYEGNKEAFKNSLFQPQRDDEYAVFLSEYLGTEHRVLTAPTAEVASLLKAAVKARDIPGQADIDSSLLWFCARMKERHTVALSGECADEIFGGYPWFYRPEMLSRDHFPWIHDIMLRASLFDTELADAENGREYISSEYRKTLAGVSYLDSDSDEDRNARAATVLSTRYFMSSLLERKDRMSMYSALEVRVPFADHRIIEYVYNVPWSIKFEGGVEKALLRKAMRQYLPDKILYRKKSPYPKTHASEYEKLVTSALIRRLEEKSPISHYLDETRTKEMLIGEGATWFGQLMGKAQLIAWLLQFDHWLEEYNVVIDI